MKNAGKEFIEGTRYPDYSTVDLVLRVPEPPYEVPARSDQNVVKLPSPKKFKVPDVPVRKAIESYEPVGFFSRSSMTFRDLSYLLWCMQGLRKVVGETAQVRNVPSSGSRYPLDIYFVASDVVGLDTGLYRYLPLSHSIAAERIDSDIILEMSNASMNFRIITRAAVTFFWVAIPYRSVWALGNRGYRSCFIEAGHSCQNLIIAAANLGYEVFPSDIFHDELIMKLIGLEDEAAWPVYLASVGEVEKNVTIA